jgi:hypothetical protein
MDEGAKRMTQLTNGPTSVPTITAPAPPPANVESRFLGRLSLTIVERHHVVAMAMWIMSDLRKRLTLAWESQAVRYSALLKDLDNPPQRFVSFARQFNRNQT